jgi:hypothetical protein
MSTVERSAGQHASWHSSSRESWIGAVLLCTGLGVGGIFFARWFRSPDPIPVPRAAAQVARAARSQPPAPIREPPRHPASAPQDAAAHAVAATPGQIHWKLVTVPAGATVLSSDGSALGKTPWEHTQAARPGTQLVHLRLKGFKEEVVELDEQEHREFRLRLHRRPPAWSMAPVR